MLSGLLIAAGAALLMVGARGLVSPTARDILGPDVRPQLDTAHLERGGQYPEGVHCGRWRFRSATTWEVIMRRHSRKPMMYGTVFVLAVAGATIGVGRATALVGGTVVSTAATTRCRRPSRPRCQRQCRRRSGHLFLHGPHRHRHYRCRPDRFRRSASADPGRAIENLTLTEPKGHNPKSARFRARVRRRLHGSHGLDLAPRCTARTPDSTDRFVARRAWRAITRPVESARPIELHEAVLQYTVGKAPLERVAADEGLPIVAAQA
jgi:hypothetical protein